MIGILVIESTSDVIDVVLLPLLDLTMRDYSTLNSFKESGMG